MWELAGVSGQLTLLPGLEEDGIVQESVVVRHQVVDVRKQVEIICFGMRDLVGPLWSGLGGDLNPKQKSRNHGNRHAGRRHQPAEAKPPAWRCFSLRFPDFPQDVPGKKTAKPRAHGCAQASPTVFHRRGGS